MTSLGRASLLRSNYRWLIYCISGLLVIFGGWSFWWEPDSLFVEEYPLSLPGWPSSAQDLRIAVLADLHTGSPHNDLHKLQEVVDATNRASPDLILLAGDFVIHGVLGGHFVEPEESAKLLGTLRAPLGVYAVLGNHDWWYNPNRVRKALEAAGITFLEDQSIQRTFKQTEFWLVGVSDFWEGAHDVGKALAGIDDTLPVILFTHNPDLFPDIPSLVDLTIAGHTHGGQVAIPLLGRPIVPSQFGERYAVGHVVEAGRHLFVSSGIGTSILPIRFRVPPEISIVTVRSFAAEHSLRKLFQSYGARALEAVKQPLAWFSTSLSS